MHYKNKNLLNKIIKVVCFTIKTHFLMRFYGKEKIIKFK